MKEDNYLKVLFTHDAFEEESVESAWVKEDGENFILDNILFYAKEYSLGDKILIEERFGEFYASGLVSESGHSTVRILFSEVKFRDSIRIQLKEMGCSSEISNFEKLISVDIPPNVSYQKLSKFLNLKENNGDLEYQEASISNFHRENYSL